MKTATQTKAEATAQKLQALLDMSDRVTVDLSKYAGLYREVPVKVSFAGPARAHSTTKATRLIADVAAIADRQAAKSAACYLEV